MVVGRRTVLVVLIVGVVPAFAGTRMLVTSARARRESLAGVWAERGAAHLASGRPAEAADDLRTAMEYAREPDQYRNRLADALLAADRPDEAKSQLLTLWGEAPGNGAVNLDLARVAARQGDLTQAVRYYHAAIDGAWDREAAAARRSARAELARLLIAKGEQTQAQAELIALAGDLPAEPGAMVETGDLLLQAGATARALAVLQRVLAIAPANQRALRLAGDAAFATGDYRAARGYFRALDRRETLDADAMHKLDLSTRVLALDPFSPEISSRERLRRVIRAYEVAADGLVQCTASSLDPLRMEAAARDRTVTERKLAADPDAVDDTLALVMQIEDSVTAVCAPASANEAALRLVLRQRRSSS